MKAILRFAEKLNLKLVMVEKILLCLILFTMIFMSFGQVVMRNLFSTGYVWVDEILRIGVLWVAFIGASLATEYAGHIKIDVLAHLINTESGKKIMHSAAQFFTIFVTLLLFAAAVQYINIEREYGASVLFKGIPDWFFRLIIPYAFLGMVFRSIIHALRILIDPANSLIDSAQTEE